MVDIKVRGRRNRSTDSFSSNSTDADDDDDSGKNDTEEVEEAEEVEDDYEQTHQSERWLMYLVEMISLGSSLGALMVSFLLLTISVGWTVYLDTSNGSATAGASWPTTTTTTIVPHLLNWWKDNISDRIVRYQTYRRIGPTPHIGPAVIDEVDLVATTRTTTTTNDKSSKIVSAEMRRRYNEDGVIAIRGLLDDDLLGRIVTEADRLVEEQREAIKAKSMIKPRVLTGKPPNPQQFFMTRQGVIFSSFGHGSNDDGDKGDSTVDTINAGKLDPATTIDNNETSSSRFSAFLEVAMMSTIPTVASILLGLDDDQSCTNETVRLMRDIFLAKDEEEYICGYHVDDVGFWPALSNASGVNAWVALDDMPIEYGGGFALAVGSHVAPWRNEAYTITGSTHTYPEGGYKSSRDILQNRPGNGTCNIKSSAPHLHRRMEDTMRVYDIKRGDVIFHTRWLFHRTIPFDRSYIERRKLEGEESTSLLYKRYSIRYSPGSAIIPPGYGVEPSVISNPDNGGRTADAVSEEDAPWYPKVWPEVDMTELQRMEVLSQDRFPAAVAKADDRRRVIRPRRSRQH